MNVFVIKTVVQDVSFSTIFYGVIPFVVTDICRLAVLIAFPVIATWLPGRMQDVPPTTACRTRSPRPGPHGWFRVPDLLVRDTAAAVAGENHGQSDVRHVLP
jgi:hypothetical protein